MTTPICLFINFVCALLASLSNGILIHQNWPFEYNRSQAVLFFPRPVKRKTLEIKLAGIPQLILIEIFKDMRNCSSYVSNLNYCKN